MLKSTILLGPKSRKLFFLKGLHGNKNSQVSYLLKTKKQKNTTSCVPNYVPITFPLAQAFSLFTSYSLVSPLNRNFHPHSFSDVHVPHDFTLTCAPKEACRLNLPFQISCMLLPEQFA